MSTERASEDVGKRASLLAFGHLLKRLRIAADLTQEELAERATISIRSISDLERGSSHRPRRDTTELLANGLSLQGADRVAFITLGRGRVVASAAESKARHNLPRPAAPLIGRLKETAATTALLLDPDVRLLTLTGPGGVGKTRLAFEVAFKVVDALPDGAFFVDLAPLRDAELVPSAIAQAIGAITNPELSVRQTVKAALHDRRLLLLLDNFEHVPTAAGMVADLLATCPALTVLATSRTPLHIRFEREYAVSPLALPDQDTLGSVADLNDLARVPAVELFVSRAEQSNRNFALTAENAPSLAEIAIRLDGLPLAIELAATRVKILSPATLLARMEQRLPLLSGGPADLPLRQQTMRATLDWSHDLLSAEEQTLFRRLAVFAGGFTLEAVEAINYQLSAISFDESEDGVASSTPSPITHHPSPSSVLDLIASLVDKSLLRIDTGPGDERRFGMLETIREYGLERLEKSGEAAALCDAHAAWCLDLVEQAALALYGHSQSEWLVRLTTEHDNIRGALGWAIAAGNGELAQRLSGILARFWILRGHFDEGRHWLEQSLMHCSGVPPAVRAKALLGKGRMAYRQGDYTAKAAFADALAISRSVADRAGIAEALGALGMVLGDLGDHAQSAALEEEALAIFRQLEDQQGIVRLLISRGLSAYDLGDQARATDLLEEALARARALGSVHSVAQSLNNLALVAHAQRDLERAERLQAEALDLWQDVGNMDGLGHCLENFAMFASAQHSLERAARLFAAARHLRARIGAPGRPIDREQLDRIIATTRGELGVEAFNLAWAAGEAMSLDSAIAYALMSGEDDKRADDVLT